MIIKYDPGIGREGFDSLDVPGQALTSLGSLESLSISTKTRTVHRLKDHVPASVDKDKCQGRLTSSDWRARWDSNPRPLAGVFYRSYSCRRLAEP